MYLGLTSSDAVLNAEEGRVHPNGKVPLHALLISILAFSVTGVATYIWPESLNTLSSSIWLLALIPSFLLAYHKGWQGAATGLAGAMVLMVGLQIVVVALLGNEVDWQLSGALTVLFIVVSLGAGWLAEAFHRRQKVAMNLAFTDELTGLANRRALIFSLSHHFAAAKREIQDLSVVMFDLDGLKQYNDRYGHSAGDEALRHVGHVLRENTRISDMTGRYGGDEFLSFLPGTKTVEAAHTLAERVRQALSDVETATGDILTISAGIAVFDPSMFVRLDLVAAADLALYAAKSQGGNTIAVCPLQVAPRIRVLDGGRNTA